MAEIRLLPKAAAAAGITFPSLLGPVIGSGIKQLAIERFKKEKKLKTFFR